MRRAIRAEAIYEEREQNIADPAAAREAVRRELGSLPEPKQTVVRMHLVEGKPLGEAASFFGATTGFFAARSSWRRLVTPKPPREPKTAKPCNEPEAAVKPAAQAPAQAPMGAVVIASCGGAAPDVAGSLR